MRTPKMEVCQGAQFYPIAVTSWVYSETPPPEGPPTLVWRSLNPDVVRITPGGDATALAAGKATAEVDAALGGHRATTRVEITVLSGATDVEATQRTGKIVCGR